MSYHISSNNLASRDSKAPAPALKENGENYRYRMFFNNESEIVDADTIAECLNVLIPGYSEENLATDDRIVMRIDLAKSVQTAAKAQILSTVNPAELKDWEYAVLTYENPETDNQDPYGWGEGDGKLGVYTPNQVDMWYSRTPLVLLDTSYDPFTEIRRPVSIEGNYLFVKNIIWLSPSTEHNLVRSLSRIGFVKFGSPRADPTRSGQNLTGLE